PACAAPGRPRLFLALARGPGTVMAAAAAVTPAAVRLLQGGSSTVSAAPPTVLRFPVLRQPACAASARPRLFSALAPGFGTVMAAAAGGTPGAGLPWGAPPRAPP